MNITEKEEQDDDMLDPIYNEYAEESEEIWSRESLRLFIGVFPTITKGEEKEWRQHSIF